MTTGPLDETARARYLIGDVQRFGLLSAATVVDRYTGMVERAIPHDGPGPAPAALERNDPGRLVETVARLTQAYLSFLGTVSPLEAFRPQHAGGTATLERITLPVGFRGDGSATAMWVHNPTPASAARIEIVVTDLISSTGAILPAAAISVSPPVIPLLEPNASRELRLRVNVPDEQPAGHYHGLVLISDAPEAPVVVDLRIEDSSEGVP
jgi:hypothetical protein